MKKLYWFPTLLLTLNPSLVFAQERNTPPSLIPYQVTVNSNQDTIQSDDQITLREAILITNNQLPFSELSPQEKQLVTPFPNTQPSLITFNLPPTQGKIELTSLLPLIMSEGLTIDGTTNPNYDIKKSATREINIPIPTVEITPKPETIIFRGLTIVTDNVKVKGLSIYGFNAKLGVVATTPPADIFIAKYKLDTQANLSIPEQSLIDPLNPSYYHQKEPVKGVIIEDNWLGITPEEKMPPVSSAFGISVFNAQDTIIKNNRISYHDGSAIITGVRGINTQVINNIIVGNGLAGMPDAIRLEGNIQGTDITGNLICGNDGSGIYVFKPDGAVKIHDNDLKFNGRRFRRSAVYLMGNDHQVYENKITYQTGPGVAISAYPESKRNRIEDNYFQGLEGLSIDLTTRNNTGIQDFAIGDGVNPIRDTLNRRDDTANSAINSPEFLSNKFFIFNQKVTIEGKADVGSIVYLYKVTETGFNNGPLSEFLTKIEVDDQGKFSTSLTNLKVGDRLTGIAYDPRYGTSEPASNAYITDFDSPNIPFSTVSQNWISPECTTPPEVVEVPPPTPEPVRLKVPRNVHFALDKSDISVASAEVLNQVAEVLKQYSFIVIELQGHTDRRASNQYNLALGQRRASSVRNYLLSQGVSPSRITLRSFGESTPVSQGQTIVDHAYDRRVEIVFKDLRGLDIIFETQDNDLQLENSR